MILKVKKVIYPKKAAGFRFARVQYLTLRANLKKINMAKHTM